VGFSRVELPARQPVLRIHRQVRRNRDGSAASWGTERRSPGFSSRRARPAIAQGALQVGYPSLCSLELDRGDRVGVSAVMRRLSVHGKGAGQLGAIDQPGPVILASAAESAALDGAQDAVAGHAGLSGLCEGEHGGESSLSRGQCGGWCACRG
jgi:hypothetical protein